MNDREARIKELLEYIEFCEKVIRCNVSEDDYTEFENMCDAICEAEKELEELGYVKEDSHAN